MTSFFCVNVLGTETHPLYTLGPLFASLTESIPVPVSRNLPPFRLRSATPYYHPDVLFRQVYRREKSLFILLSRSLLYSSHLLHNLELLTPLREDCEPFTNLISFLSS